MSDIANAPSLGLSMPDPSETDPPGIEQSELAALTRVGKTYPGGTEALEGFSLELRTGEFVSLLGPSGCGKSTVLRLLAELEKPTAGSIARPAESKAADAKLSYVFQEPTLMPWASVWDNVYLPLRLQGVRRRDAAPQVDAALRRVGLEQFAHAYPRQLSGGMKMRVSVARATINQPRLLLLDEPFAALDEITRFKLNDDLLSLWTEQGWTAVFVTHSVFESVYLSSRVLVMSERPGRVVDEIPIPLPYPRTPATRMNPEFAGLCRRVSSVLELVMNSDQLQPGSHG